LIFNGTLSGKTNQTNGATKVLFLYIYRPFKMK